MSRGGSSERGFVRAAYPVRKPCHGLDVMKHDQVQSRLRVRPPDRIRPQHRRRASAMNSGETKMLIPNAASRSRGACVRSSKTMPLSVPAASSLRQNWGGARVDVRILGVIARDPAQAVLDVGGLQKTIGRIHAMPPPRLGRDRFYSTPQFYADFILPVKPFAQVRPAL